MAYNHHQSSCQHHIFTTSINFLLLFPSSKLLLNIIFRWIFYVGVLVLILNIKNNFPLLVNGAYSEADDLINDLDRPSK